MCGGSGTERDKQLHNNAEWRCDTIEVWRKGSAYEFANLLRILEAEYGLTDLIKKGVHIIFTGGEPLLQQKAIVEFVRYMCAESNLGLMHPRIEVETNGTIVPSQALVELVHRFNVSPKLSNSGELAENRVAPAALDFFSALHTTRWKFVISKEEDFREVQVLVDVEKQRHKLWLMPAASNREGLDTSLAVVAKLALRNKVRFSTRLQIHIWNEVVGV